MAAKPNITANVVSTGAIRVLNNSDRTISIGGRIEILPRQEGLVPVKDMAGSSRKGGKIEVSVQTDGNIAAVNRTHAPKTILGEHLPPNGTLIISVTVK